MKSSVRTEFASCVLDPNPDLAPSVTALAARKDIRDNFDNKIAGYTKTVSDLLREPYKLEVNFNQFYAYAAASEDGTWVKTSPGTAAANYFESFITYLKRFTDEVSLRHPS